jgi:hypothetical protein
MKLISLIEICKIRSILKNDKSCNNSLLRNIHICHTRKDGLSMLIDINDFKDFKDHFDYELKEIGWIQKDLNKQIYYFSGIK